MITNLIRYLQRIDYKIMIFCYSKYVFCKNIFDKYKPMAAPLYLFYAFNRDYYEYISEFFISSIYYYVGIMRSKISHYVVFIKQKEIIVDEFFKKKFKKVDESVSSNKIIKQNRSLIYVEVINLLNRRQKGKFYAPLLSFWPLFLTASLSLFLIFVSFFFHSSKLYSYLNLLTIISLFAVGVAVSFWFSIFYIEKKKGNHGVEIRRNIQLGFYLFLFTEALCFIALFWVFLHSFLAASLHIGVYNPGEGIANIYINEFVKINENWNIYYFKSVGTPSYIRISSMYSMSDVDLYKTKDVKMHINFYDRGQLINPYKLPLLNTFILLTSAATLNASHVSLRTSKYLVSFFLLAVTILLGLFFVSVQYKEYKECSIQYNDGIYAACFFSLTGLHGIHVMIGISALFVCFANLLFQNYSPSSHQSYMYSILYWHFVDVIWVLVYFIIYLWPASYFFIDELFTSYKKFFTVNFSKIYFNKIFKLNSYLDFKSNTQKIYAGISKNFNSLYLSCNLVDISKNEEYSCNSFVTSNFYSSKWFSIKNFIEYKNIGVSFDKLNHIIQVCESINLNHEEFIAKHFSTFNLNSYLEWKNFDFVSWDYAGFKLDFNTFFDIYDSKFEAWGNFRGEDWNLVEKEKYFIKFKMFDKCRKEFFSINCDFYLESLQNEYIESNGSFNYNEIKKDPLLYCFILTEMHKELVNAVKCAYFLEIKSNYKKFMIYKFFNAFGLQDLRYFWCFIFFPYMNTRDASIWYRL